MKKIVMKLAAFLPAIAFVASIASLNSACYTCFHQPEVPSALDSYRH